MTESRWIRVTRDQREGRACRVIGVFDALGAPLLEGIAFPWRRDIVITSVEGGGEMLIRRRRLFPFTGRLDVLAGAGEARIGIVSRSGRLWDGAGAPLGRFVDARSLGQRAGASAFEVVGVLLTGIEGGDPGRMAEERRWLVGDAEQGRLMRAKWPFDATAASATWRFDFLPLDPSVDRRLPVAAAIWHAELSYW